MFPHERQHHVPAREARRRAPANEAGLCGRTRGRGLGLHPYKSLRDRVVRQITDTDGVINGTSRAGTTEGERPMLDPT